MASEYEGYRCTQARNHESEVTGDHMEGREDQIGIIRNRGIADIGCPL